MLLLPVVHSNSKQLVLYSLLLLLISIFVSLQLAHGQCHVSGCSSNRCFCTDKIFQIANRKHKPGPPVLHWYKNITVNKLSSKGCVANGDLAVCPYQEQQQQTISTTTIGKVDKTDTSLGCIAVSITNGLFVWGCTSLNGGMPLPLVNGTGHVIASDGINLMFYSFVGVPRSSPVRLYPEQGELFDLVFTEFDIFVMIYKCGFMAMSDTSGVHRASIFLNDTYHSINGTFIPLATPAVVFQRMYLPTAFWPHNVSAQNDSAFILRLYAIDVTLSGFHIAWNSTRVVNGYLPILEGNYEACKLTPPPSSFSSKKGNNRFDSNPTIRYGHVTAFGSTQIFFGINFKNVKGGDFKYITIGYLEGISSTSQIFYNNSTLHGLLVSVSSLSYVEMPQEKHQKYENDRSRFDKEGRNYIKYKHNRYHDQPEVIHNFYLTAVLNTTLQNTTISIMNITNNVLMGQFNLDTLLAPLTKVQMTTDFMSIDFGPGTAMYVIVGITGYSGNTKQSFLIGIAINSQVQVSLLWKAALYDGCTPQGLMPVVTMEQNQVPTIVVSTDCGLAAYVLSQD